MIHCNFHLKIGRNNVSVEWGCYWRLKYKHKNGNQGYTQLDMYYHIDDLSLMLKIEILTTLTIKNWDKQENTYIHRKVDISLYFDFYCFPSFWGMEIFLFLAYFEHLSQHVSCLSHVMIAQI